MILFRTNDLSSCPEAARYWLNTRYMLIPNNPVIHDSRISCWLDVMLGEMLLTYLQADQSHKAHKEPRCAWVSLSITWIYITLSERMITWGVWPAGVEDPSVYSEGGNICDTCSLVVVLTVAKSVSLIFHQIRSQETEKDSSTTAPQSIGSQNKNN